MGRRVQAAIDSKADASLWCFGPVKSDVVAFKTHEAP